MRYWNLRGEQKNITKALQIDLPGHTVIAITGAGGKSSLLFEMARELASQGRRTAVTTTTHMGADQTDKDIAGVTIIASDDPKKPGKVKGPSMEELRRISLQYDALIIEADGARHMPLKWPKAHEPVVPEFTDVSICVAGLSSLDMKSSQFIYNYKAMPEAYKREYIDDELIAAMLSSLECGLKGTYGEYRVFLNQADTDDLKKRAAHIQALLAVRGIQSAWGTLIQG